MKHKYEILSVGLTLLTEDKFHPLFFPFEHTSLQMLQQSKFSSGITSHQQGMPPHYVSDTATCELTK